MRRLSDGGILLTQRVPERVLFNLADPSYCGDFNISKFWRIFRISNCSASSLYAVQFEGMEQHIYIIDCSKTWRRHPTSARPA